MQRCPRAGRGTQLGAGLHCSLGVLGLLKHPWHLHPPFHVAPISCLDPGREDGHSAAGEARGWAAAGHSTVPLRWRAARLRGFGAALGALGGQLQLRLSVFSSPAMSPVSCYLFSPPFCISSAA